MERKTATLVANNWKEDVATLTERFTTKNALFVPNAAAPLKSTIGNLKKNHTAFLTTAKQWVTFALNAMDLSLKEK